MLVSIDILLCCYFLVGAVFFLSFSLESFWGYAKFFRCWLEEIRHRPGFFCSFSRGSSFCLFAVCTLKDLHHAPAVDYFGTYLAATLLMFFGIFLCVEYLLFDTGYK